MPKYISWKPDPYAWKIDAFSCQWPDKVYLFPPINLINKSIHKFIHDKVVYGVIITPAWPGLSTLPDIISLLFADPTFIPSCCLEGQLPTYPPPIQPDGVAYFHTSCQDQGLSKEFSAASLLSIAPSSLKAYQ